MSTFIAFVVAIVGIVMIAAAFGLIVAIPVMWLWNWLAPDLFHLPIIGYWQAYGIYLLCAILFKSSNSCSSKS